jgi:hypothetical protein
MADFTSEEGYKAKYRGSPTLKIGLDCAQAAAAESEEKQISTNACNLNGRNASTLMRLTSREH